MLSVPSLPVPVPSKLMPVSSVPVKVPAVTVPLHSKYISDNFDNVSSVYGKVDHGRTRRRLTTMDNNGQQWTTTCHGISMSNVMAYQMSHVMAYQCRSCEISVDLVRSR